MSGNFLEGKVPEISPTLIDRGMSMFEHTGFTGETIGQPYGISICNKSHRKFRISRGQRLGRLCQEVDWVGIFNNLNDKEEDEDVGDDVNLAGRNGLVAHPGGSSLGRRISQGKEEDIDNCNAREEGMNTNNGAFPGMEDGFVKTSLC